MTALAGNAFTAVPVDKELPLHFPLETVPSARQPTLVPLHLVSDLTLSHIASLTTALPSYTPIPAVPARELHLAVFKATVVPESILTAKTALAYLLAS